MPIIVGVDVIEPNAGGPVYSADAPWGDLVGKLTNANACLIQRIAIIGAGMVTGRPSVIVAGQLNDGTWVALETSGDMWETVTGAVRGARERWGVEDRP